MKKLTLLSALAVILTGLTSCYKTWTCVCTITTTSPGSALPKIDRTYIDVVDFKKGAARSCDAGDESYDYGSIKSTSECELTE